MNRRVSSFIFLCGLLAGCLLLATPLEAQNIKQVIESLAAPGKAAVSDSQENQGAAEQLVWVNECMKAARERLDLAKSEAFQAKVRAAGFPENRPKEIQSDAEEALDSWTNAKNLLEWIVVRETVGIADTELPSLPATTSEAITLERGLEDLEHQLSRFEANQAAQPAAIARAEQQSRSARHDLAEIRLEAESPLAANARERSDVDIFEATIAEDNAAAQLFFQKWLGYRLELETGAIRTRSQAISTLLRDSGYSRLLSASRASTEISQIEKKLPGLDKQEQEFSQAFDKSAARLAEARSRLDAASAKGSAPPADLQRQAQSTLAEYAHQEFLRGALRARSYAARHTSGVWKRVLEVVENTNLETLGKARSDLALEQPTTRDLCDRAERFLSEKKAESEKWMQDLRMPDIKPSERASLQDRIKKNETLIEQLSILRDESASLMALQNRLLEELDDEIAAINAQHRWRAMLQNLWSRVQDVWNFQISSSGDREVTLGTILTAIIALLLSLVAARYFAHRISSMLERRLGLPGPRSHLVEKLTLYALSVAFVLMVLQWLQIPLTIFAFLGGALAVGLGFGSQNLINNFISGLLLLLEQKINVGDLVEVDGNFGRVTDLGSRCSSIRKFDGVEILVPNSTLLEKNVVNWTLSDPMHRFDFGVGVAYGSDVELVMRTLREALDVQPEILRDPAPEVSFENFGESTLDFHVYYWLEVGVHSARDIGTQLRVRIDRLFNQRAIVLAFPQRDVNLVAAKPIQVRLEKN